MKHYMNASHIRNIKTRDDFPSFKMAIAVVFFMLAACAFGGLISLALA
jgi:hypothetical protein